VFIAWFQKSPETGSWFAGVVVMLKQKLELNSTSTLLANISWVKQ